MGSEWQRVSVEDIQAESKGAIAIGPFGSRMKSNCYVESGVPVIRGTNITGGPAFKGDFVFISEAMADSLGSCNVYEGDLVFPHRGAIGEVGIVPEGRRYVISSSLMKLTCDRRQAEPRFLYYFFRSHVGRHELLKNASQVGTPGIGQPLTSLKSINLTLPSIPVQQRIAHILGTLDYKIELNRRMNETLAAMAQALFKSWFVDFDPVIDKALAAGHPIPEPLQKQAETRKALGDRRRPLPTSIAQHFPNRFVLNEEMGWVPDGWEVSTVGTEYNVTMGQSPPGRTYNEIGDGMPFFQGRADFGFRYPSNRVFCTAPKRLASKGDSLVSVRAPVGDVNMAADDCCIGRGIGALRHNSGSLSFTYYSMLQLRARLNVYEAEGTVFGSINQKDLKALPQLSVTSELVRGFDALAGAIDSKIELNSLNALGLAKFRDTLLPKLLSGELRVPDAEKQIEKAL